MFQKSLLASMCAALAALAAPASAQDKTVLRVGTPSLALWMMPMLVAQEKGMLAAEKLELKFNFMRGGSEAAAALVGGNIDIMSGALSGVLILRSKGVKVQALSAIAGVRTFALVVDAKRHANVNDIQQIKGMKIATSRRGSDGDLVMRVLLNDANLGPEKDVSLIQIGGYENHVTAVEKGEVDGSMLLEPFLTIAREKGIVKPVVDLMAGQGPEALNKRIWTSMSTTEDFIKQKPQIVQGLVRGISKAVRYIESNEDGSTEVARKYFPTMDPATLRTILKKNINVASGRGFHADISREAIELENKFLVAEKFIAAPVKYEDVIATEVRPYWQAR